MAGTVLGDAAEVSVELAGVVNVAVIRGRLAELGDDPEFLDVLTRWRAALRAWDQERVLTRRPEVTEELMEVEG